MTRFAIGVAAAALAAGAVPLTATADSSTALPADWTTYGPVPAGATIQTVLGTSDGQGGCEFDFSASLSPDDTTTRADEVGFSPSTCESQVAYTSGASAAPEPDAPSNSDSTSNGPVDSQFTDTSITLSTGTVRHSAGYFRSWYEDPVGIVVNSVKNGTDWHWDGICVIAPVSGSFRYTWHSSTGWSLQAHNWRNVYGCSESTSSSYAHFHNGIFCKLITGVAAPATDTYYNRNNVHGKANGVLSGSVHARKSGGCNRFLSFHASLKRTLN